MQSIYGPMPREVGKGRKLIHTWDQLTDYVNRNNGSSGMVSTSLYAFDWIGRDGKPDHESAIIDKVVSDFDPGKCYDPMEEARRLDIFYTKHDLKRLRVFSGGGFHVLASAKPNPHTLFASATLKQVQEYITSASGIRGFDTSVGNYASQHIRILNTWNGRRQRYCIPLTADQFWTFSMEEIRELAQSPQALVPEMWEGNNLIDISKFEPPKNQLLSTMLELDLGDVDVLPVDLDKNCMVVEPGAGNHERYILISSLVEKAYGLSSIKRYLRTVLAPSVYNHCVNIEKQPDIIYNKALVCYKCRNIRAMGLCKDTPQHPCPYEYKS